MILSFKTVGTEDVFDGRNTREARRTCPVSLWRVAARKLDQIDSAVTLDDLRVPPGNRLEALSGNRQGQHSIRLNDQYRLCFAWTEAGAALVEIVDYHQAHHRRRAMIRVPSHRRPTHPGEMLREEFLKPMGLTQRELADCIRVPYQRVNDLVNGRRGITPSTALRLARFLNTSADFWMNVQMRWDLYFAQHEESGVLKGIRPYAGAV